ncbi:MAG TPA: transporter substrate-binding domain-containing protein, partial [Firmicutes bacterium]|nr:transporter substrate-binding domain-containing protein [Bacillota bacterium]
MKRLLALACLCSLVVVAFAAPGVGAAKPVLKVGTSADFPPFEFQDEKTGAYLGFDLDLIRAIGDAIGM